MATQTGKPSQDKRIKEIAQKMLRQNERSRAAFEKLKAFDSMVFVEMPHPQITTPNEYRGCLEQLENKWLTEFNKNPKTYHFNWNEESGVNGQFGENYFATCKLFRYDGSVEGYGENDFRAKRGFLIRDHYYAPNAVFKAHAIADNLIEFLKREGIEYKRFNFYKESLKHIEVKD